MELYQNDGEKSSKPGYYAIIPAEVRYDDRIPANAKLLYGELSALLGAERYCFASNGYFARLYGLSERTITGLLKTLKDCGYISMELRRGEKGQIESRKIYLNMSTVGEQPVEEIFHTPRKDFLGGIENNCGDTNTSISNIDKKEKEKKEKRKDTSSVDFDPVPQVVAWIGEAFSGCDGDAKNALYLAFVRFFENRNAMKKPVRSKGAVTALCNKLCRLSNLDLSVMIELLDTATVNGWQSVFPLKPSQGEYGSSGGREYECL